MKKVIKFIIILVCCQLTAQSPNDCEFAIKVCNNISLRLDVNGIGEQEIPTTNPCSFGENNSTWLQVEIAQSGTLGFTIIPSSSNLAEDYDFWIFGPDANCEDLQQPIRCSTTNPLQSGSGNNETGLNSIETDNFEGPGPDGNNFVSELNVLTGESYFIVVDRPVGNSPFSIEWTGTATFPEFVPPIFPADLVNISTCDNLFPFDDGIAEFDLTNLNQELVSLNPHLTITYHFSESSANTGDSDLGMTFNNFFSVENRIYIRFEDRNNGCFSVESLRLIVDGPSFNQPFDYIICDDPDNENNNGNSLFNLQNVRDDITNNFDPNQLEISFHLTQLEAEMNSNAIIDSIIISESLELFVRILSNGGCVEIYSINISVVDLPLSNNVSLIQCDLIGPPDGLTLFNLSEANNNINNGINELNIQYFINMEDAQGNNNAITGDVFANTSNPQVIYARVESLENGCFNIAEITLVTSTTTVNDAYLIACDDDGLDDGYTNFNLREADSEVLSGLSENLNLEYYETLENALLEIERLDDSFVNTVPFNQDIFVRAEDGNNCYGIAKINLRVSPRPDLNQEFQTFYCVNEFPNTINISAGILNDDPNNYHYLWSTGETSLEIAINEPGTYTVLVTNNLDCSIERRIVVLPSNIAIIDNILVVDGTQSNSILVAVSGEGGYEFSLNDPSGPYQDSPLFENLPPELYTLYVRDKNGCGIIDIDISVIGFPRFFSPNSDGVNDFWQIKGITSRNQLKGDIQIFDRYGKLLVIVDPTGPGWDGSYDGKQLPANDYWFTATLEDGRTFTSHFALKR